MKRLIYLFLLLILAVLVLPACSNKTYTITIHYKDNVEKIEVKDGSTINFEYNYDDDIFLGWYNEDYTNDLTNSLITSNIDIYPLTTERGIQYKISYDLDGGRFNGTHPIKYYSGEITYLVDPIKDNLYEFTGWTYNDKVITNISDTMYGNITLKATWKDVANYYKINLHLDNATLSSPLESVYRENSKINLPYPIKEDSYFRGWFLDKEFKNPITDANNTVTSDLDLYPKFINKDPSNTYISFFGDSITTFESYIPSGFSSYYPQGDVSTVNDTWWYQVTENLGYNLLMNNSYSGTKVSNGTWCGSNLTRVNLCMKDGIIPDIIIIHMGTNDFANGVNEKDFKESYIKMIDLIKEKYDDVIIYVVTHPHNAYNNPTVEATRLKFNQIIIEIAKDYNLKVLRLESVITDDNYREMMYAGSHPNKKGMKVISDYVTNEIKGLN